MMKEWDSLFILCMNVDTLRLDLGEIVSSLIYHMQDRKVHGIQNKFWSVENHWNIN